MEYTSVCNHARDNKIERPRNGSQICLSRARLQLIGEKEVLLPINHKNYNYQEKKNSQAMKERENLY